jgi:hypothetical protein
LCFKNEIRLYVEAFSVSSDIFASNADVKNPIFQVYIPFYCCLSDIVSIMSYNGVFPTPAQHLHLLTAFPDS